MLKRIMISLLVALLMLGGYVTQADAADAYNDGNLVVDADAVYPVVDDGLTCGKSGKEFSDGHFTSITVAGVNYTSLAVGSDGNWTGAGLTTYLDSAPTKFVATHSSGQLLVTILDTNDITGTTNDQTIDLSTNNKVILGDNSDTFTVEFDATDTILQSSDGAIVLKSGQADGEVHFKVENDSDDYLTVQTNSNVPTITTIGSCNLALLSSSGEITFGDENLTTTGTLDAGATTVTSVIVGDDTLDVVVDDQCRFASNDEESTIEAYGFEAKDAVLQLTADEGDDAGDKIQLVSDQATNSLFVTSDTSVKDTHATILTVAKTGLVTTTNDVVIAGATPKVTVGDAGEEDAQVTFDGNAQDYSVGLDDTTDSLVICKGSSMGTTNAVSIDANLNVVIAASLKTPYQIVAATETLTANESMKLIVLNHATEFVTTLPTVASSAGVTFHVVVGAAPVGASYTVVTNAGENKISGVSIVNGASVQAADEDTITFTASAAAVGDWVELTSDGVLWYVSGQGHAATAIVFTAT